MMALVRIYADVTEISFKLKGLQLQWERMSKYLGADCLLHGLLLASPCGLTVTDCTVRHKLETE